MKEKKKFRNSTTKEPMPAIPELDIIDLDAAASSEAKDSQQLEDASETKRHFSHIYVHIAFLAVVVFCIVFIVYRFTNWGDFVDLNEIFKDGPGTVRDTLDQIMPLIDRDGNPVYQDYGKDSVILAFGNAPFADDRDSEDNLVNIIQDMTDATIYNCSISGSYLAAGSYDLDTEEYPWDAFTFYGLCRLAIGHIEDTAPNYLNAVQALGEDAPEEAMEVYNILTSIDMNTVDAVVVMYDASDYLAGHNACNASNVTDATYFTGNMEAGIECLQVFYPGIRIIILSPAYAYGIDENGNYISSDIQTYASKEIFAIYVHQQSISCFDRSVSFVDNLYGTITEDNAADYLIDHLHLNVAGRKKIAQRFIDALNYFQK